MAEPFATITDLDLSKLSDETGFKTAKMTFKFDIDVIAYTVRCLGNGYFSGKECESGVKDVETQAIDHTVLSASELSVIKFMSFLANEEITAEIDYTELYQEGNNQINVYGQSVDGTWSSYQQVKKEVRTVVLQATVQSVGSARAMSIADFVGR